ncbi:hypothetical protein MNBD_GAMMA04-1448 [hydrothermal vent metagenome]|uniref:DUF481 domain-containing protein n=1 Tax=hydrothermal vent metagenome TaxID=652676 RepID=A0A3B0WIZ0_9ZZZZ
MLSTRSINAFAFIGMTLIPLSSLAADPELGFSGSGEAGYSSSTGNTTTTSAIGAIKMNYNQISSELKSILEVNYKSENDVQTQERYFLDLQRNQFYDENRSYYSFIGGQFENSRFEEIDLDATLSLGLGKRLYHTDSTTLTAEIGLGFQSTTLTSAAGGKTTDQTIGRLKLDFNHKINEMVTFSQDALLLAGSDRTKLEANTGFKVKVADNMNVKASYKYRYNDNPATASIKKTDTQTNLTLIYDF